MITEAKLLGLSILIGIHSAFAVMAGADLLLGMGSIYVDAVLGLDGARPVFLALVGGGAGAGLISYLTCRLA